MANQRVESSEEETLFRSYPYAALYFVQSPSTTTLSHHDAVSFHSPATTTQRRLALSHYSSSRGSTASFLHDKKVVSFGPQESPEHGGGSSGTTAAAEEKCRGLGGGDGAESEAEEEEGFGKRVWRCVSFTEYDSWAWIWFQISIRVMVSFGVALFFFYLITKPPPPVVSLKIEKIMEFGLGEGVDNTGVTTTFLTCNCSLNLHVVIKSPIFGLHIHPPILTLSFNNLPLATSRGTKALYAPSNGPTSFVLHVGTTNRPVYGAGIGMQDALESGKGLPLVIRTTFTSSFHVVSRIVSRGFRHRAECVLVLGPTYKKHTTITYKSHCNML